MRIPGEKTKEAVYDEIMTGHGENLLELIKESLDSGSKLNSKQGK
jgi:hypothetical protein